MRVALIATAAALTFGAGPALAQSASSGGAAGLRYLSWPGKPAPASAAAPAPVATASETGLRPAQPTYSAPQAYASIATPTSATPTRRGLTPASDWLSPQPTPQPVAAAPYSPQPQPVSRTLPPPIPTRVETQAAAQPEYLPDVRPAQHGGQPAMQAAPMQAQPAQPQPQGRLPQRASLVQASPLAAQRAVEPAPQPVQAAPAQPVVEAAADPMAPRRDAPIFRMGQPAPMPVEGQVQTAAVQPASSQPTPPMGSARYYSVHRQAGHQPDPTPLPQPTYLDGLPVELISPPQSADLAEPQAGPALIRNQNGTVRAAPAQSEGDYQ